MDSIETLKEEIAKLTHRSRVLEFANETLGRYVREGQEEKAEWKVRAIQAERERDEARQELRRTEEARVYVKAKKEKALEEISRLEQANAVLLDGLRFYATQDNHARDILTQYDTAPKEDKESETSG